MKTFESIALGIPNILLPKAEINPMTWAVIACDQFTSEPEYWQKVKTQVGQAPSTLNLIYPEVYIGEAEPDVRIAGIREHMQEYLDQNLLEEKKGFIFVERKTGPRTRKGLIACLDLDQYDFHKGSKSLIRATEGTILDRLPPRVKIREGAPMEVPHIMVLLDDPENTILGPLSKNKDRLELLYDFDLMMDSGHLTGYRVTDPELENGTLESLKGLAEPETFAKKYGLPSDAPALLYAMGDGNHSLATAKTIWETTKEKTQDKEALVTSPLRYALVELVNLHDQALSFEPIHRVLFEIEPGQNPIAAFKAYYGDRSRYVACSDAAEMRRIVDSQQGPLHKIGVVTSSETGILEVKDPDSNLPVGTLQNFLDAYMDKSGAKKIDYIHGTETILGLGKKQDSMGFYLPVMEKDELFKTVILDGALPRKTFSMGEAWEKRFYMEARRLG